MLIIKQLPSIDKAFWKQLWHLAIPISLQSMMFALLGLTDILMVGQLGEIAVGAVGLGNRFFFFNMIIIAAFSSGFSVLASQFMGVGDSSGIRRTLIHALGTSMIATVPFIALYLFFTTDILLLAASDPKLLSLSKDYLLITAPSFLSTAIVIPLESALRATNDARTPTRIGFVTILLNIVLSYWLIFGELGLPAMGVAGSAWGTTIARFFQLFVISYAVISHKRFLLPKKIDFFRAFKSFEIKRYLRISIPVIFQDGLWAFGVLLYHMIYSNMGVNELAIMSALAAIESLLISFFLGFAIASSIILGQALGASHFKTAWQQGWFFLIGAPLIALFMGLLIALFSTELVTSFGRLHTDTVSEASQVMMVAGFALCLKVTNLTGIVGVLRSGGDVKATAIINIISMWCVGLPLTWLAAAVWSLPLYMVFICSLTEELTKALLVFYRVMTKRWLANLVANK